MMEFIVKVRANAKRATMVQSRIKTVEKMDLEAPEPVEIEQVWNFSIPNPEPLGRPVLSIDDVSFDYEVDAERVRIERARIEGSFHTVSSQQQQQQQKQKQQPQQQQKLHKKNKREST